LIIPTIPISIQESPNIMTRAMMCRIEDSISSGNLLRDSAGKRKNMGNRSRKGFFNFLKIKSSSSVGVLRDHFEKRDVSKK